MVLLLAALTLFLTFWAVLYVAAPVARHAEMHLAKRLARWSLRFPRVAPYLPVILVVAAGGVLIVWMGDGFIDLVELLQAKSPALDEADTVAHRWAASQRHPLATLFFSTVTMIGGPAGLIVITLIVSIGLIVAHRYRWCAYLLITSLGASAMNMELKRYFARARPDLAEALRDAHGYSFPSGHAMGATAVFGALSYLVFRTAHGWKQKSAVLALAGTMIAAVCSSRVYLGVHWVSDVGAGLAIGGLWVTLTTVAYESVRRIRLIRAMREKASPAGNETP